jgi:hypothetical protein
VRDIETDAMVHDAMIQDVDVMSRGGGGGVEGGKGDGARSDCCHGAFAARRWRNAAC